MAKIEHKGSKSFKNTKVTQQRPDDANIYNYISPEIQIFRVSQSIQDLRDAIRWAESILNPQRYNLYRTYKDSEQDPHLSACMVTFRNLVLSREINFYKPDGEVDVEKSKLLKTKWFRDFCVLALDSRFWGFSLIQLGNVTDDGFSGVELIPRQYVKPEFHIVTQTYSAVVGEDYLSEPYNKWVIPVGNPKDLGLLMQASYYAIWKKTAMGSWAEYTQIFGVPTRVLKTNTKDAETMKAADRMMKSWGPNQYLITNGQDELDIKEASRSDASKVFMDLGNMANDEMSKLILGGTGIMDEKSFVGAAKVHERVTDRIKHDLTFFIEDVVNRLLKPLMIDKGFALNDVECKITDNTDVAIESKIQIDLALIASPKYKLSAEYIEKTYGSKVEEVELPKETEPKDKNGIINELNERYGLNYGGN